MDGVLCHFYWGSSMDDSPLQSQRLQVIPPVGSVLFVAGDKSGWRVVEVEYQFHETGKHLNMVHIELEHVRDRSVRR